MNIHRTSTPVWQEIALDDTGVTKFVLPAHYIKNFLGDSGFQAEVSGYLTGAYHKNAFYVAGVHRLCVGKCRPWIGRETRTVGLEPEERTHSWLFTEEASRRFAGKTHLARTVLWHNHYRTSVESFSTMWPDEAPAYLETLAEELADGDFDYLAENGNPPTLDDVVNEVMSRRLSEADVRMTPGNTHLLVTDTSSLKRPLAHLNAFQIVRETGATGKLPIEVLEEQSPSVRDWYATNVENLHEEAHTEACERFIAIEDSLDFPEMVIPPRLYSAFYLQEP